MSRAHCILIKLTHLYFLSPQGFTSKWTPLEQRKALLWFRIQCLPYIME